MTLLQDGELEGAPPGRADAENVVRLSGDPEVARTLGGVRSPVQSLVRLEHWLDVWRAHGFGPWVFHRHGTFIGYAGLGPAKATSEGEIELLYALLPEAWGKGLATRILFCTRPFANDQPVRLFVANTQHSLLALCVQCTGSALGDRLT